MALKRIIKTRNKEIYSKLNLLSFCEDVVLKNVNQQQMTKIMNNINKNGRVIDMEKIGNYFLLKKKSPINFAVYFVK